MAARWRELNAWLTQPAIQQQPEFARRRDQLTSDIDHLDAAITRQLTDLADQRVGLHEQTPPRHLIAALGDLPDDAHDRHLWRDAARTIELYRLRWGITDPARPLGDEPADPLAREDHQRVTAELVRPHRDLALSREHPQQHVRDLSR